MLILKVAWRNIFRQKRRSALTVLTIFGGFTLSAIQIGLADGTYNRIIEMFTRNKLGHIQIHANNYLDKPSLHKVISDYSRVGRELDSIPEITRWAPRVYTAGLGAVGDQSSGIRIIGVDPKRENSATNFDSKITSGNAFLPDSTHQVILGEGVMKVLKAKVGDELVILSQGADGSMANDLYTIVGISNSGDDLGDRTAVYLPLKSAQELLVLGDQVHEIAVVVSELDKVSEVTTTLRNVLKNQNLEVSPWQEFAKSFYQAMQADRRGDSIMRGIVILIVAIGVLNTVLMTVLERRREYGILRAIGTQPMQVFRLVLYEVTSMALISIAIGLIIGLPSIYFFSLRGIELPTAFTYGGMTFSHLTAELNAHSFYLPALTVLLTSIVVSIIPALQAARVAPMRALRMH